MKLTTYCFLTSATLSTGLVAAQSWGNFSGQVSSIEYLIGNDYSLTSDLVISLNESWSLVDIIGRRDGQIGSKSVVFNTADNKYYAKIAYTNTATSQNDTELCFPSVPIRISLNQNNNGTTQLRLVDGSFDIGCVEKTRVDNVFSTSRAPDNTIGTTSLATMSTKDINVVTETGLSINFKTTAIDADATSTSSVPSAISTSTISTIPSSSAEFVTVSSEATSSHQPSSTLSVESSSSSEKSSSVSATSAQPSTFIIQTISSGSPEPTSTVISSSTVFEVHTSSFVTFITTTSAPVSTVIPKVSASSSGNSSINGVDQSNTAAKMASIESSLYMGAFVTLLFAAIFV